MDTAPTIEAIVSPNPMASTWTAWGCLSLRRLTPDTSVKGPRMPRITKMRIIISFQSQCVAGKYMVFSVESAESTGKNALRSHPMKPMKDFKSDFSANERTSDFRLA